MSFHANYERHCKIVAQHLEDTSPGEDRIVDKLRAGTSRAVCAALLADAVHIESTDAVFFAIVKFKPGRGRNPVAILKVKTHIGSERIAAHDTQLRSSGDGYIIVTERRIIEEREPACADTDAARKSVHRLVELKCAPRALHETSCAGDATADVRSIALAVDVDIGRAVAEVNR